VQGETRHLSHDAPTLTQRNSLSLWSWGGVTGVPYFYSVCLRVFYLAALWHTLALGVLGHSD